jgi:hypothetical protein
VPSPRSQVPQSLALLPHVLLHVGALCSHGTNEVVLTPRWRGRDEREGGRDEKALFYVVYRMYSLSRIFSVTAWGMSLGSQEAIRFRIHASVAKCWLSMQTVTRSSSSFFKSSHW